MAEADEAQISQAQTILTASYVAQESQISQAQALAIGIYPSEFGEESQQNSLLPLDTGMDAEISQFSVLAVCGGRVANPSLKVATFTLDGHDFYVLYLGNGETLLYDLYSKRWVNWGTYDATRWRNRTITNWPGVSGISPASPVVAGDDTYGTLYFLDPEYPYDEHPLVGSEIIYPFYRIVQGQISHRGRNPIDCFGVILTGSFGDVYSTSLTEVSLSYSDDAGKNYIDAGTVEVSPLDYAARVEWPSLGLIYAPGRMFRVEDQGALARIDGLDMETSDAGS